jgi:sigma-B regulation protein RsbU (phosphoserine phosphatase)
MPDSPAPPADQHDFEGDYRPAESDNPHAHLDMQNVRVEPADLTYLVQMADALNTTLDLETLLSRTSELVRAIIHYRIFAIFLLNDRTHELRMRFQIGHTPEVQRTRIPLGRGIVGQVALTRQPIMLNDVSVAEGYIPANPDVRSELAVPLIAKNRLIGVMDLESEEGGYFRPEHLHLLTLTASRIAQAIENARLYARVSPEDCFLTRLFIMPIAFVTASLNGWTLNKASSISTAEPIRQYLGLRPLCRLHRQALYS